MCETSDLPGGPPGRPPAPPPGHPTPSSRARGTAPGGGGQGGGQGEGGGTSHLHLTVAGHPAQVLEAPLVAGGAGGAWGALVRGRRQEPGQDDQHTLLSRKVTWILYLDFFPHHYSITIQGDFFYWLYDTF